MPNGAVVEMLWYGPEPRRYADPIEIVAAGDLANAPAALGRIDEALASGYSVAGYVAYDAGFACVELPARASRSPLLELGIFAGPRPSEESPAGDARLGPLVAQIDRARYVRDLGEIARALHDGDVYQTNYTVPFAFAFDGDPLALAALLRERAQVPYAATVRCGDRTIVSLSPELFFAIDGDRVRTKPMKGTSLAANSDALASAKNRAEHVMIVDLLRNDLHRVCDDVAVTALFEIERYPTFATMTSTIDGRLARGRGVADLLAALFPCGSITGAPKRRAMALIADLEGEPRSIAMGSIGYCDAPRRGMWSVAIRTADLDARTGRGTVRIGGGIVADSDATAEWAEVLLKRRVFADAAQDAGIFETMRARADGTLAREAAHLARLERSAFALGIPFDVAAIAGAVAALRAAPRASDAIVRLALDRVGAVSTSERPITAAPPGARACVAAARLRASDPVLRHKTTARDAYDAASREARERGCFEALLLNDRGLLADGARTTLFVRAADGRLATPRLADGALAGILRAELLASGAAYEADVRPRDLAGREAFVGNAVRGLVPVVLETSGKEPYRVERADALRFAASTAHERSAR